jgi:preprotein translocase subunit SecA
MGFFSSFFSAKKKGIQKTDRVYLTRKAANNAIVQFIVEASLAKENVIVIYFFKETKHELDALITNTPNVSWVNGHFSGTIRQMGFNAAMKNRILVADTHPDFNTETSVLAALETAGYMHQKITFFNGLDDPIFIPFGAERIQKLMVSMGLKEDEPVEHKMITTSIDNAQKKVMEKKMNISRIDSREEMLRRLSEKNG